MHDKIDTIVKNQQLVDNLLKAVAMIEKPNHLVEDKWNLQPLYQDAECSVVFGMCGKNTTVSMPEHCHEGVKEYLIVVRGAIALSLNGQAVRILHKEKCASIPPAVSHSSRPLEPDTKVVAICVPSEPRYRLVGRS